MNLYLIEQDENNDWETISCAVVAAQNEEEARNIHPSGNNDNWGHPSIATGWASSPKNVDVKLLGVAIDGMEAGSICAM